MIKKIGMVLFVISLMLALVSNSFAETPYVQSISKTGCPKDSLVLVSWNGGNFGKSKTPETLVFMAKILRDADIVVIEEVSTTEVGAQAVAKLSDELNRTGAKWDYAVSDPTFGPGSERFAFLWKTSRVQAMPRRAVLSITLRDALDREPAKVSFKAGNNVLAVHSFHLVPTSKKPEGEVGMIGRNPAEFMSGTAVFVGDFNLGHRKLDPVFEGILHATHCIEGKTSLKRKVSADGSYLSKEYDNIYARNLSVCRAGILDFTPPFTGNLEKAREVSDHLPVFVVFTFTQ